MSTNLLTSPIPNAVYQRDNNNRAYIPIVGSVSTNATSVTVILTSVVGPNNRLEETFSVNADKTYSGFIDAVGGWYSLSIVDSTGATNNIERVGVGEVFILFGHSYIQGGHDENRQLPANDDRVVTLLDTLSERNFRYGKLTTHIGPFHGAPDAWGQLGDLLVSRLGVPVLFYGCAYGGSNLEMSLKVINGQTLEKKPPGYSGPESRQPFAPLEDVLTNYVPKSGVRAILCEHGYNDRGTSRETFTAQLKEFFTHIRTKWQMESLPVVLVQEQLTPVGISLSDIPTAQAQQDFIATFPNVWEGPNFNGQQWNGKFDTFDHMYGDMIDLFASDWNNSLSDSFFSVSTPYPSTDVPLYIPNIVVSNAATSLQLIDWVLLLFAGIVLVLFYIKRNRRIGYAFLLLALLCLSRLVKL